MLSTTNQPAGLAPQNALAWCSGNHPDKCMAAGECISARKMFASEQCVTTGGCAKAQACAVSGGCDKSAACISGKKCTATPVCPNISAFAGTGITPSECGQTRHCIQQKECTEAKACAEAGACAEARCALGRDLAGVRSIRDAKKLSEDVPRIGLAFSGGGIRSATFNLGILQGLQQLGLLRYMQYLSTVSGGGYIGSFLTSAYYHAARPKSEDTVNETVTKACTDQERLLALEPKSREVLHLRQFSRYLAPKQGFLSADTWTIFSIWIRNALLVQIQVILGLAIVLLSPRLVQLVYSFFDGWLGEAWFAKDMGALVWIPAISLAAIVLMVGLKFALRQVQQLHPKRALKDSGDPPQTVVRKTAIPVLIAALLSSAAIWPMVLRERTFAHQFKIAPTLAVFWKSLSWPDLVAHLSPFLVLSLYCWWVAGSVGKDGTEPGWWTRWFAVLSRPFKSTNFSPLGLFRAYGQMMAQSLKKRDVWEAKFGIRLMAAIVPGFFGGLGFLALGWIAELLDVDGRAQSFQLGLTPWWPLIGPSMVLLIFSFMLTILIGILGRDMADGQREWWSRLSAWLLILASSTLVLSLVALQAPPLAAFLWKGWATWDWFKTIFTGWGVSTLTAVLAGKSGKTGKSNKVGDEAKTRLDLLAKAGPLLYIAGLLIWISVVLDAAVVGSAAALSHRAGDAGPNYEAVVSIFLIMILFAMGWIAWSRFDLNEFSMHHFYRNRLVRCYLGATNPKRNPNLFTGFDFLDDIKMARLFRPVRATDETFSTFNRADAKYAGPFPIVNVALNASHSDNLDEQDRRARSFVFTPLYSGFDGSRLGTKNDHNANQPAYRPTEDYIDKSEPHRLGGIKLGTAMAISGAAASPNMGFHTSSAVAFLLTMFNVRLGWWVPNPADDKTWNQCSPTQQFLYLIKELFGSADPRDPYVYVSDGGHFENLAVYELVRRRCKIIVACDAEEDDGYAFQGLAGLIRKCRIDFRAKIDIDVSQIRPNGDETWSGGHIAIGTIAYEGGETGQLIYVKSSMTGDESTDVLQYKRTNSTFPHESTGDQFFSEDQFESYRALGKHIILGCFEPACEDAKDYVSERGAAKVHSESATAVAEDNLMNSETFWTQFVQALKQPGPTATNGEVFTRHTNSLMALWSHMAADPDLAYLDSELFSDYRSAPPTLPGIRGAMSPSTERKAFYQTQQMMRLMENVFMDLDFDVERNWKKPDNAGWHELFLKWGSSQTLQAAWEKSQSSYNQRFQLFCKEKNIFSGQRSPR